MDWKGRTLGRFWTEALPKCMHRVVATAERTSLLVYLAPMVPHSVKEAKADGPTQIVIRTSNGRGEMQHAWPHNASARFLLSQCLKQLGGEAAYKHVTLKKVNGRQIGMDEIVPEGSTVFVQLDINTTSFVLNAGGKWGSQHVSDGEVIKNIRQVRPQLETQQVKALLGGSPKLLKAAQNNVQGKQLLDQVMQEEKRQGMVPKLGWKKEGESGKAQDSQTGWQQVSRKGGKKPKIQEELPSVKRTMQLQAAQVVCEGRPLPVREVLLHGYGGVCIVRTKDELLKMATLRKTDGRTPQVAIAATRYELSTEEQRAFVQAPIETSLRFTIKEEGLEGTKDATARCCICPLTAKQVHVVHAQEHSLSLVDKEVLKVQINSQVQCGKGIWVPKDGDLSTIKRFVKQITPEAFEQVVECWKPKLLEGPTILMKVKATNASKVASRLTEAGFSATPSRAVQDGTKVAWTKAESLAKEVLKDLPTAKKLDSTATPWTRESALFIKGSMGRAGQASFGLRLPAEYYTTVQERLGRDARKMYTIAGAPRLPADTEQEECSEQVSTEAPWSAWDASAVQEDSCSHNSYDDEWCEEDDLMANDWLDDEPQEKFETRKRRANEQREAEPVGC
eukprot:4224483-Amphidinium_carterae.3